MATWALDATKGGERGEEEEVRRGERVKENQNANLQQSTQNL